MGWGWGGWGGARPYQMDDSPCQVFHIATAAMLPARTSIPLASALPSLERPRFSTSNPAPLRWAD